RDGHRGGADGRVSGGDATRGRSATAQRAGGPPAGGGTPDPASDLREVAIALPDRAAHHLCVHGRPGARPAGRPPDAAHYTLRRIHRPALAGRIAGALSHGVHVMLAAEAGFGKTAVLEEALALLPQPAWRLSPSEAAGRLEQLVAATPGEDVVVVVDDAEQLADDGIVALL